jgi:hypothetical protein
LYLVEKASANITPSLASQPGLSIPGQSFGRSDATLSRVGKAFALTLARHRRPKGVTSGRLPDLERGVLGPVDEGNPM